MKILGRISGDEMVLDKSDGFRALKLVDSLPDPASEDVRSVQLETSDTTNKAGDIFTSDGSSWKKVESPDDTVGEVTNIICPREGGDVRLRWADPADRRGYVWKHTRLLRKYGSYPTSIWDGVVVTDSYVRDQYFTSELHDFLPAGTEKGWYYRFFTFSEDEVQYSSEGCMFVPIELSWKTINKAIRDGHATKMFAIGDVIKIDYKDKNGPYAGINFEVAAINQAIPSDLSRIHSVTFLATATLNAQFNWDITWSRFQLTTDTIVVSKTKEYFIKDGSNYIKVEGLRLGSRIPADTYYEQITTPERIQEGGNRWARCELRRWLQSTDPEDKINSIPPFLSAVTDEIAAAIQPVRNTTSLAKIDGGDYDVTIDKIFIPSASEVYGIESVKENYFETTDKSPSEYYMLTLDTIRNMDKSYFIKTGANSYRPTNASEFNADGSFKEGIAYYELVSKTYYVIDELTHAKRVATEDDFTDDYLFKEGVVYFEKNVVTVMENDPVATFRDEDLNSKERYEIGGSTPVSWWLRTPDVETVADVMAVSSESDHEIINGGQSKSSLHHVVMMFTVS